ncbi:uncharacterized protein LOC101862971 [Aplysia californica]|uniref:Uncharacterized protein LOC101862971 n=1 Tax=Aplysia californica TaxID=6500 RepID=A0ABM0K1T8_APLCA|nr:uncharacterized protein LOC101862971 [Aplysia californica]
MENEQNGNFTPSPDSEIISEGSKQLDVLSCIKDETPERIGDGGPDCRLNQCITPIRGTETDQSIDEIKGCLAGEHGNFTSPLAEGGNIPVALNEEKTCRNKETADDASRSNPSGDDTGSVHDKNPSRNRSKRSEDSNNIKRDCHISPDLAKLRALPAEDRDIVDGIRPSCSKTRAVSVLPAIHESADEDDENVEEHVGICVSPSSSSSSSLASSPVCIKRHIPVCRVSSRPTLTSISEEFAATKVIELEGAEVRKDEEMRAVKESSSNTESLTRTIPPDALSNVLEQSQGDSSSIPNVEVFPTRIKEEEACQEEGLIPRQISPTAGGEGVVSCDKQKSPIVVMNPELTQQSAGNIGGDLHCVKTGVELKENVEINNNGREYNHDDKVQYSDGRCQSDSENSYSPVRKSHKPVKWKKGRQTKGNHQLSPQDEKDDCVSDKSEFPVGEWSTKQICDEKCNLLSNMCVESGTPNTNNEDRPHNDIRSSLSETGAMSADAGTETKAIGEESSLRDYVAQRIEVAERKLGKRGLVQLSDVMQAVNEACARGGVAPPEDISESVLANLVYGRGRLVEEGVTSECGIHAQNSQEASGLEKKEIVCCLGEEQIVPLNNVCLEAPSALTVSDDCKVKFGSKYFYIIYLHSSETVN